MKIPLFKKGNAPDTPLAVTIGFLVASGIALLASASFELGELRYGDSWYYLKAQLGGGAVLGLLGFFIGYKVYYRFWQKLSPLLLILNIILLALIFTPLGVTSGGATRWIALGPLTFQPSELLKITYILYLAAWLSGREKKRTAKGAQGIIPFATVSALIAILLVLQPATSIVVILLAAGFIVLFLSGAALRHIASVAALAVVLLALVTSTSGYRYSRIEKFLEGLRDPGQASYHIQQARAALRSGGIFGSGYQHSHAKIKRIPAVINDSIFAIAGSEFGFAGSITLVTCFAFLAWRSYLLALRCRNKFGALLLGGFGMIIAAQAFIHIAAISGLVPATGVPLPFISYGGTALVVFLTMSGIMLNVTKYSDKSNL